MCSLALSLGFHKFAFAIQSGNTFSRRLSGLCDIHGRVKSDFSRVIFRYLKSKSIIPNERMAVNLAPTVKLNNGYEMPILGLGTYELKKSKCEQAVRAAIDIGYRHIDTAYLYRNESLIGKILHEKILEGSVRREDIFLVTKLWNIFHEPERVEYACCKQLESLNVHYIDLYLMHSPVGYPYVEDDAMMPHDGDILLTNEIDYVETYKAMEQLVDSGFVRSLGVSNFNSVQLKRLLENCRIKPVTNQSKNNEAGIAVKHAIDVGYRHIDTAYFYQNEAEIGQAVCEKIAEGAVKREDMFIVTKLWNIHHEPERVESACRKQLKLLGLDYIDLYLMHLPVGYKYVDEDTLLPKDENDVLQLSDVDYLDTYKAMEKLVDLGLVRSIGVSNFNSVQVTRIVENCRIKPVTNQVECSPALNQKKLISFCKQHDITLTAYSPLGRPKPDAKTPKFYFSDKTKAIADKYNKTPAQIILRYLVEIGTIPIPKSSNPGRITENFQIFDFKLDQSDLEVMDGFNTGERLVPFNLIKGQNHKYFPFAIEF